jgi:hypothetical protein
MIQLLYSMISAEMVLILTLLFNTPLRKLVIITLDRVKRGRGPIMLSTVAGTIVVVLLSNIYSMVKIQSRTKEAGAANPTDQVLMSKLMLEASLMGNFSPVDLFDSLFLCPEEIQRVCSVCACLNFAMRIWCYFYHLFFSLFDVMNSFS